jgi:hypothetical protein
MSRDVDMAASLTDLRALGTLLNGLSFAESQRNATLAVAKVGHWDR